MKVKRKVQTPITSFWLPCRKVDEYSFNIHLFKNENQKKASLSIVISKDKERLNSVSDRENVISVIELDDPNKVKPVIKLIGDAMKKIYSFDRPIYDKDLILSVRENLKEIDLKIWDSPFATYYKKPNISNGQTNSYKSGGSSVNRIGENNGYSSLNEDLKATKPIILIETLAGLGLINVIKTEPNGDETKYKFSLNNVPNLEFNISVVKHHGLEGPKSELFKDFYNTHKKGLGRGGLGVLTHIGEYGFFGQLPLNESNEDKILRATEFFEKEILPNLNRSDLVFSENSASARLYLGKSITFQPIEKKNFYREKLMFDFLRFRGLSEKLINKGISENLFITGDFYISRIQKEKKENGEGFKDSYGYNNANYIRLRQADGTFFGAERFQIQKTKNDKKPFNYDKKNIGSIEGKYFSFGEQNKPKAAIVHEAIIDAFSSYDLIDYSGQNPDSFKYISTQGASHMKKFFSKNLGFSTNNKSELNEDEKISRTKAVSIKNNVRQITPELKDEYISQLENKRIVFIDDGETPNDISIKLEKLNDFFNGIVTTVHVNSRDEIDFKSFDKSNDLLVDKINFDDFLNEIRIQFSESEDNDIELTSCYTSEVEVNLNEDNKLEISRKIKDFFKTDHVVYCLDNDHAGLPYMIYFAEMKRNFGINVSYMIPEDLSYENFKGLNLKTMLNKFNYLCDNNEYDSAYELVHEYASQKPKCDNNDTLKKYIELKDSDPKKAKDMLADVVGRLKFPPIINSHRSVLKHS